MSDVNAGFTPEQARQAARLFPELVHHVEPDGTPVLRVSKEELLLLQARLPTMFKDDPAPGSGDDAVLKARYPSMYGKKR